MESVFKPGSWIWLGATDVHDDGNYAWVRDDGGYDPMNFTNWDLGQPNNGENEACVAYGFVKTMRLSHCIFVLTYFFLVCSSCCPSVSRSVSQAIRNPYSASQVSLNWVFLSWRYASKSNVCVCCLFQTGSREKGRRQRFMEWWNFVARRFMQ